MFKTRHFIFLRCFTFVGLLLNFGSVNAMTGTEFYQLVRAFDYARSENVVATEVDFYKVGQFVGFIRATTQQGVLANVLCNKDNVTLDQMQLIVAKYFKNNPERWQDPATLLILEALNEAFCK